MKKTVALIFGGEGTEREISCRSSKNLHRLIDKDKFTPLLVEIQKDGQWRIWGENNDFFPTFPTFINGKSGFYTDFGIIETDTAIPCLHGDFGEDGIIQGALTAAHIKYIGQDVTASAVSCDKAYTKLAAEKLGIRTAKWIMPKGISANAAKEEAESHLTYPMFIKPTRLGSSYGVREISAPCEFISAFNDASSYGRVIIEEKISFSYEAECAYFDNGKAYFNPHGRILNDGKFYDYESKYSENANARPTLLEDESIDNEILEASKKLVDFIGLRGLSRIDFFVCPNREIYFNEINSFPGMTKSSLYPRLTEEMNLGDSFINLLIEASINDRNI